MKRLLMLFLLTLTVHAATDYYADPDWAGTESGTEAQPWNDLGTHWSDINTSLASGAVTIYFSARDAGSDVDDQLNETIAPSSRTDGSGNVLTFDGNAKWNQNDSTPSWTSYSGSSKSRMRSFDSGDGNNDKNSNITIRGFHVVQSTDGKCINMGGDNIIVENNDCEHSGTGNNPGIQLIPTADGSHEGSGAWVPACTNIIIRGNTVHNTIAEAIYIGGGGSALGEGNPPGAETWAQCGYPSHSQIVVSNNVIFSAGAIGLGQGDGIDVKGGLSQLTIVGNTITNCTDTTSRAIVIQGVEPGVDSQNVIERNYIWSNTFDEDAAIAVVDSWGTNNNLTIRNNVIANTTSGGGIKIYATQSLGVHVYNNTIVSNSANAGITASGSTSRWTNNIVFNNNGAGNQFDFSGTATENYSAYTTPLGISAGANSISTTVAANLTGAATGDYSLLSTAPAKDVALTIASFSNDRIGTTRPQGSAWDIGAQERIVTAPALTNILATGRVVISGRVVAQ